MARPSNMLKIIASPIVIIILGLVAVYIAMKLFNMTWKGDKNTQNGTNVRTGDGTTPQEDQDIR